MFNVGGGEVLVILVLALVVLGPDKLPEAARSIGKHIGDFRRISNGFRSEISNAMDLSSFTGPTATPAEAPVAPRSAAPQPATTPSPSVPTPSPDDVTDEPAAPPVRAAVADPAPVPSTPVPARSSRTPAPAATPDQDRELVPSAPVWADGPVDSFV